MLPPSDTASAHSNKFRWSSHAAPRASWWTDDEAKGPHAQRPSNPPPENFVIRSLKQGATGAVKTWPVCDVLLDYLVRYGGLRDIHDKLVPEGSDSDLLDLNLPSSSVQNIHPPGGSTFNIIELGAGTGCLGVGLVMSLNQEETTTRVMCTDNDRATIKNMRFNISEQPRERRINKAVRIETLGWGKDIGGEKFSQAVATQFRRKPSSDMDSDDDPLRFVTHVVASDCHFGTTTLDPLSSVISAFKLRNPDVIVIVLIKERNPQAFGGAAEIKSEIETKVRRGMEIGHVDYSARESELLQDFSVSVRDVLHRSEITNMKMIEC